MVKHFGNFLDYSIDCFLIMVYYLCYYATRFCSFFFALWRTLSKSTSLHNHYHLDYDHYYVRYSLHFVHCPNHFSQFLGENFQQNSSSLFFLVAVYVQIYGNFFFFTFLHFYWKSFLFIGKLFLFMENCLFFEKTASFFVNNYFFFGWKIRKVLCFYWKLCVFWLKLL